MRSVVPIAQPDATVGAVLGEMIGTRYTSAAHIVVCDHGHVIGLVRLEDLLGAESSTPVADLMDSDPPTVTTREGDEVASWKAVRHGESALTVVDDEQRLVDVITPRRMVEILLTEHDEDLARLGGFLASTASARHAIEEPLLRRLAHRLPWLLLGLAGAVVAALIVGRYERELADNVLLAFFVPGIVYMADAVGTQTEALVIRGLSVGVPIGRILRRELATGLIVGVTLAAAFVPVGLVLWNDADVILSVALALLAASSTATVVAMSLPWLLSRAGHDPAFGSGPLATVIQDLLSLVIYFAIASIIVA